MTEGCRSRGTCVCQANVSAAPSEGRYLFIWPVNMHAATKLRRACVDTGCAVHEVDAGMIVTLGDTQTPADLLQHLLRAVTREEAEHTRVLVAREPSLQLADVPNIRSLRQATAYAQGIWLRTLLAEHRLTSVFQPIVRADRPSEIIGYEALLRGVHEDGSLLPAGMILSAARDAGLMTALDVAGRTCAIREAKRHHLSGLLFINFTPTAVYDPAACLMTTVKAAHDAGLNPASVVFEVIEAEELDDLEHVQAVLQAYRAFGFRVALDDIGSGYSGLSWLSVLRPDFLKIDRQLVHGVADDHVKATILNKIIELGHELGITVIAEGVERLHDFFWLRDHGAALVQGFLFARPAAPPPAIDPAVLERVA
ncbi:EAL domain-containing protein [Thermorudis peleae]|uniref:EAL domain-containing protein n=1 Tax=Thermorudis peleae TaxID=1382356 RepID=UPI0005705B0A|nr:EAL domain-containing protein [Thermorudis peleae]